MKVSSDVLMMLTVKCTFDKTDRQSAIVCYNESRPTYSGSLERASEYILWTAILLQIFWDHIIIQDRAVVEFKRKIILIMTFNDGSCDGPIDDQRSITVSQ